MLNLFTAATTSIRMHPVNVIGITFFLVLALYGCASQALPVDKVTTLSKQSSGKPLQSAVWYDGHQQRKVWINPVLVAEFGGGTAGENYLRRNFPGASVRYDLHSVRIWEMPEQQFSQRLLSRSDLSSPARVSVYSPVLHETRSASSRMRALPGNIIVYLDPALDKDEVKHWIQNHGFEVVKKIEIRPNAYVFKTGPGLESLQAANALYESGDVVAAFPDWWLESVMR